MRAHFGAGASRAVLLQKSNKEHLLINVPRVEDALGAAFEVPLGAIDRGAKAFLLIGNVGLAGASVQVRTGDNPALPAVAVPSMGVVSILISVAEARIAVTSDTPVIASLVVNYGKNKTKTITPLLPSSGGEGESLLAFPFADPSVLTRAYCYGLYPWSSQGETHNGVDLVPAYADLAATLKTRKVGIVAPYSGTIDQIVASTTGAQLKSWLVLIRMNAYWYVAMAFEPQTQDAAVLEEQANNFLVQPGQTVKKGDLLGYLVLGNIATGQYPHVHLSILYKNPADTVAGLFANPLAIAVNDGTSLPPVSGQGSPWEPEDLNLPSTFFCPYVYSSANVRSTIDHVPRYSATGGPCSCVCAYHSQNGDCGVCR
jgi:hypothetical protein